MTPKVFSCGQPRDLILLREALRQELTIVNCHYILQPSCSVHHLQLHSFFAIDSGNRIQKQKVQRDGSRLSTHINLGPILVVFAHCSLGASLRTLHNSNSRAGKLHSC
jgi:hypothetical protein